MSDIKIYCKECNKYVELSGADVQKVFWALDATPNVRYTAKWKPFYYCDACLQKPLLEESEVENG